MARRDLEELSLDLGRVRSRTDFLEAYANTTHRDWEESLSRPDPSVNSAEGSGPQWTLAMDMASALREAASWAVYFDVDRAIKLLIRSGSLYRGRDMAFGSFLLTVAGAPPLEDLSVDIGLLARVHGRPSATGTATIPDPLRHPQQQAYLLLACAGMADRLMDSDPRRVVGQASEYRQVLNAVAAESPIRQGVLPFGSLGIPVRIPWDIGVHLLRDVDSNALDTVARHLAALCRRYSETMELANVNDYLWSRAAAPVDVGDIDVIGIAALAFAHFGSEEMTASVLQLGVQAEDISSIPLRLAREISERTEGFLEL